MKHVSILIPQGDVSVVNIMGSYQVLGAANEQYQRQHRKPLFEIDLVGFGAVESAKPGAAQIMPTKWWKEVLLTDLIIIPAVHDDPALVIRENQELLQFVTQHYKNGATVSSMCIGAYLLAASGLLNGKNCSVHWQHAPYLQAMFPQVQVKGERLITDQQGIITSGGAYAFTNLLIYLVEKYGGRELAVLISKLFMIDIDRKYQSVYQLFAGQKEHRDETVLQVQEYIENNIGDKFTIDELAQNHNLVRRTLERRFRSATGNSIIEYTQKVRMEAAKINLEKGRKTVSEVMYDCGYTDSKAFRDVFKKCVGLSPLEYRKKYMMEVDKKSSLL